jgi:hypothetical protein
MKRQSETYIQDVNNKDRLSDLPDHLLLHIFEFMNIKCSIQTCVLSKRWKDLWKSLTNLTFHHSRDRSGTYNKFVSHILSGRDDSLPLHKLIYFQLISKKKIRYFLQDSSNSSKTTLLEVMKYAASHNVEELTTYAGPWLIKDFELPHSIFHCHSLTSLKLDFGHPYSCGRSKIMFPKSLNLPALKTLFLSFLTFFTSENGCAEPFSTCKMLSTLVIIKFCLEEDAQALCIFNSNVSSLTVASDCTIKGDHSYEVVLSTPKLTSLTIMGCYSFLTPSTCNLNFLEEGNIHYRFCNKPLEELVMIGWLHLLANVKKMTLSFESFCEIHKVISYFSIF